LDDPYQRQAVDIVVFTPTAPEFAVASNYLDSGERLTDEPTTTLGTLADYRVAICMPPQMGGYAAAESTRRWVQRWQPRWVAVVGIAGGFHTKGVKVGDVVIASRVYGYEFAKVRTDGVFERRDQYDVDPDPLWVATAKVLEEEQQGRQVEWALRVRGKRPDRRRVRHSHIHVGPVASGEKVVDDPSYPFFQDATRLLSDLYGIEMEAAGAGAALRSLNSEQDHPVGFLMVRGISDVPMPAAERPAAPPRRTSERDAWKRYATQAAMGVLDHLLRSRRPPARAVEPRAEVPPSPGPGSARGPLPRQLLGRLPVGSSVFVGRDDELRFLNATWKAARRGS
jgi:nucleoside phosphorylase